MQYPRLVMGHELDVTARRKRADYRKQGLLKRSVEAPYEIVLVNVKAKR